MLGLGGAAAAPAPSFSLGKPCFSRRGLVLKKTTVVDADSGNNVIGVEERAVLDAPRTHRRSIAACILLVLEASFISWPGRKGIGASLQRAAALRAWHATAEAPGTLSLRSGDPPRRKTGDWFSGWLAQGHSRPSRASALGRDKGREQDRERHPRLGLVTKLPRHVRKQLADAQSWRCPIVIAGCWCSENHARHDCRTNEREHDAASWAAAAICTVRSGRAEAR